MPNDLCRRKDGAKLPLIVFRNEFEEREVRTYNSSYYTLSSSSVHCTPFPKSIPTASSVQSRYEIE